MEWMILFAASWILFILLKGWQKLQWNVWCGIASVAIQIIIDTTAIQKGMYIVDKPAIMLWSSSAFFCFGPVFVISILLSRYQTARPKLVVINVVILTALYSLQEYLLLGRNALVYYNWSLYESVFVNFLVIITLSWISYFILSKGSVRN